ncbi:hypothetical protein AX769_15545 [Frondihabitans sp. PAMC 28766]|nr:hypothetical protein AX769_15545 [Frondihabitans sp. PAMC 28766]
MPSWSTPNRKSISRPRPERPSAPETATTSPACAPSRRTGSRPPRSPNAVTAIVKVAEADRSPPTTPHPGAISAHPSRRPSAIASSTDTGVSGGTARAITSAVGRAPIAATSDRFEAAAFQPMSCGVDHASRKSGPCTMRSVVTTNRPSGAATTAASSPGPSRVLWPFGSRGRIRASVASSPMLATVSGPGSVSGRRSLDGGCSCDSR